MVKNVMPLVNKIIKMLVYLAYLGYYNFKFKLSIHFTPVEKELI